MRATHGGEFDVTNRGLLGRRKVVEAKDFCVVGSLVCEGAVAAKMKVRVLGEKGLDIGVEGASSAGLWDLGGHDDDVVVVGVGRVMMSEGVDYWMSSRMKGEGLLYWMSSNRKGRVSNTRVSVM